jgi:Uma2 family endonuclease
MTSAEFLALPETMARMELIDGEVIIHAELDMSPAPAADHQRGVRRSTRVIETVMSGGEVFFAPFDVRLDAQTTLQPDVFWLAPASLERLGDGGYLDGAPDLVVEVLSPGTTHLDRGRKFKLYEQYGVREYWLVDMQSRYVEVYRRAGEKFERLGAFAPGEIFTSAVLDDAQIDPAAFFSDGTSIHPA